jgi:hypothetical protein
MGRELAMGVRRSMKREERKEFEERREEIQCRIDRLITHFKK